MKCLWCLLCYLTFVIWHLFCNNWKKCYFLYLIYKLISLMWISICWIKVNHRILGWLRLEGTWVHCPVPPLARCRVSYCRLLRALSSHYPQCWRLHNLPEKLGPVVDYPHSKKCCLVFTLNFIISVFAYCLLPGHWAPLSRVWFHLPYSPQMDIYTHE